MTQWGLDTLFNPAKRHMDEEKQRLQSTREEVGDSSGGKRIDLESGKVVIARAESDAAEDAAGEAQDAVADQEADAKAADGAQGTGRAQRTQPAPRKSDEPESPARARARARRAKK